MSGFDFESAANSIGGGLIALAVAATGFFKGWPLIVTGARAARRAIIGQELYALRDQVAQLKQDLERTGADLFDARQARTADIEALEFAADALVQQILQVVPFPACIQEFGGRVAWRNRALNDWYRDAEVPDGAMLSISPISLAVAMQTRQAAKDHGDFPDHIEWLVRPEGGEPLSCLVRGFRLRWRGEAHLLTFFYPVSPEQARAHQAGLWSRIEWLVKLLPTIPVPQPDSGES